MAKFWALVGNENLKLRRRKFIWIALAIILVVSLGFSALIGIFTNVLNDSDYYNGISDFPEFCEREIEFLQEQLQNETDPALRAAYQRDLYQYRILSDCVTESSDWRYTTDIAMRYAEAKAAGNDELAARMERLIRAEDYLGYYRYLIEENETLYAANPTFAEAANAGYRFCIENDVPPSGKDWRYGTAMEMSDALLSLRRVEAYAEYNPEMVGETLETAKNRYALLQYRLEKNIRVNPGDSFQLMNTLMNLGSTGESSRLWDTLNTTLSLTSIVLILTVILAAGMVASEFGKGTIKFLLITPAARWKILLAKYCSLLINMGLFFILLLFGNLLFGILFCGGGDFFLPILTAAGGEIKRSSPILLLLGNYLLELVGILVMSTLAFMISSLFRNAGAAVGISLLIMYGGNTVNSILALVGADWGRYLIFANINLSQILRGVSVFPHQNIGTAIVVLLLHMVVFLWTAFDAFDRKEI